MWRVYEHAVPYWVVPEGEFLPVVAVIEGISLVKVAGLFQCSGDFVCT